MESSMNESRPGCLPKIKIDPSLLSRSHLPSPRAGYFQQSAQILSSRGYQSRRRHGCLITPDIIIKPTTSKAPKIILPPLEQLNKPVAPSILASDIPNDQYQSSSEPSSIDEDN